MQPIESNDFSSFYQKLIQATEVIINHYNLLIQCINPLSTRPHQMWSGTITLDLVFWKCWIMYQKKEKNFLQKMSPHLSQLNVAMAHSNYFRQNNLQILKLATYKCKLANFRLKRIAKYSHFILSVDTKRQVLLIFYENKDIYVANLINTIEVDFLLGINIWGICCFPKWCPALAFIHLKSFI